MNSNPRRFSACRRLLSEHDDDPLGSIANLFDVAMVFAVALLVALVSRITMLDVLIQGGDLTVLKNPGRPNMEIVRRQGEKLEHYRISEETLGGEGQRLGIAYRLKSGEVVYVPEHANDSGDVHSN